HQIPRARPARLNRAAWELLQLAGAPVGVDVDGRYDREQQTRRGDRVADGADEILVALQALVAPDGRLAPGQLREPKAEALREAVNPPLRVVERLVINVRVRDEDVVLEWHGNGKDLLPQESGLEFRETRDFD